MFLKALITATTMILSCSPAAKESSVANQETTVAQKLSVLSAIETDWIGGVQGVRGKIYTIRIKSKLKQIVTFSGLEINGEKILVTTLFKNNIYTVTARTSNPNTLPDAGAAPGSSNITTVKNAVLLYTEFNSKTIKKLSVPKFTHVENVLKSGEEPVK